MGEYKMSEFHRMITYLYLYEQGIKSRNTGFAKIERRKQQCLLEIHMKNTGCSMSPVPVYFYVQQETRLAGIPLGNFSLTRGSGDFKTILDAENLKDSGYRLQDVKGIYIPLTERMMLVSQWDDDEFHLEDFVELAETEPKVQDPPTLLAADTSIPAKNADNLPSAQTADNSSSIQDAKTTAQNTEKNIPAENSEITPPAQHTNISAPIQDSKISTPSQNIENTSEDTLAKDAENVNADAAVKNAETSAPKMKTPTPADAVKALEALPRSGRQAMGLYAITGKDMPTGEAEQQFMHSQTNDQQPMHSQADEPESWGVRWRFILENYPVMTPFRGDERTLCVRMELKDLRQLPKQFWYLGNNSFLLHGFFNYRYFILGMTEEFGVKKWFIGVPGVFQNPERVMAALFGFPEFRSEKDSPVNTGQFGYWYRYLNELSEPSKK